MAVKLALISVSDKTGVVEFAKGLSALGVKIISSGGTSKELSQKGVSCREISDVTGFPEILDGRVKTLNPKIHGGILARRDKSAHLDELKKHSIDPIDLVVVNLYPFENTVSKYAGDPAKIINDDIIENIDIGGVALIRASAKNFMDVLIVVDPSDYEKVVEKIKSNSLTQEFRRELAAKAFRHTAYYDALISGYFTLEKFPQELALPLKLQSSLRYGENPHQAAAVYKSGTASVNFPSVINAKVLQGKELSYNNYLDLESAWKLALEFDKPCCAIIKHNNACGCAEAGSILDAYLKALSCDTVSAFGGVIAFNREVDEATANEVVKLFTECIAAPSFSEKAKIVFASKKNLRLLELGALPKNALNQNTAEYRTLEGGSLAQERDSLLCSELKTVTNVPVSESDIESLKFAMKVCKHVKSNAIILVRGTQTVGVGAGQMSRIDSLKIASEKMNLVKHGLDETKNKLVLASDAFFPFNDVVLESSKIGVKAIIQPGGSIKDADSIKACDERSMSMVFTGTRHFRH